MKRIIITVIALLVASLGLTSAANATSTTPPNCGPFTVVTEIEHPAVEAEWLLFEWTGGPTYGEPPMSDKAWVEVGYEYGDLTKGSFKANGSWFFRLLVTEGTAAWTESISKDYPGVPCEEPEPTPTPEPTPVEQPVVTPAPEPAPEPVAPAPAPVVEPEHTVYDGYELAASGATELG